MSSSEAELLNEDGQEAALAAIADEFSQKLLDNEHPQVEHFVHRIPGQEQVVREVLQSIELMHRARAEEARSSTTVQSLLPTRMGEYEILNEAGRGGMGVVYRARQTTLDRIVALKVLPVAASLDPVKLRRFQIETQSASMLQHPHIVAVHGTGCEAGVHYYAMQFVDGFSLDRYLVTETRRRDCQAAQSTHNARCDSSPVAAHQAVGLAGLKPGECCTPEPDFEQGPLTVRQIVELIRDAASALQHAHELGIVHRDVKPSNLMLDRSGKVWVTDFGLARIENEATLTATGDLIGTLRYMSPEQVVNGELPVDHRCDVYSLGVTLYELLTLRPMVDGDDRAAMLRQLTYLEPQSPRKLNRSISRELETVIMKATAHLRDARYGTAAAFADDLQRYLDDRPVVARRPGISQRLARTIRRNRTAAAALAAIPFLIVAGLTWNNVAVSIEKQRVEVALAVARNNEITAQAEARKALAVSDVLQELLAASNPDQSKGNEYTVRQLLDDVSLHLFDRLQDQPAVVVGLRSTIGNAYRRLGAPQRALPHLQAVWEWNRQVPQGDQRLVAKSLLDLAWAYAAINDHNQSERLAREAIALLEQTSTPAADDLSAWWCLQHSLIYQEQYSAADEVAQQALELAGQFSQPLPIVANITHDLAQSKTRQGDHIQAERLATAAVDLHSSLHGPTHPETGWGWEALARALQSQRKNAAAAVAFRKALAVFEQNYPDKHKSIQLTLQFLEEALSADGQADEAQTIHQRRFMQPLRDVLSKSDDAQPSVLAYLLEQKQFLVAGGLVLLTPEAFQSTRQCLNAVSVLEHYQAALPQLTPPAEKQAAEARSLAVISQLLNRAVDNCPDEAQMQNALAWNLVALQPPQLHQPQRAVELAKRATELSPEAGEIWNTLGLAYYRAAQYPLALDAIERSRGLASSDEYDLVFLAMIHQRLGHVDKAHDYLQQAEQQNSLRAIKSDELERFIAEAHACLAQEQGGL